MHKINRIKTSGNITKVFFFNTDNYTIIDTEDYDKVKDYCWHKNGTGYACTTWLGKYINIHKLLFTPIKGKFTDHINGDPLDNRKCNLRACTKAENARNCKVQSNNTSGAKGVSFCKRNNRWDTCIIVNKKQKWLGYFKNKQDAINARHAAEIKYFGEFAPHICRNDQKKC